MTLERASFVFVALATLLLSASAASGQENIKRLRSPATVRSFIGGESHDSYGAAQGDRETVLQACATLFGPPVDSETGLFEVNRFYVLEARFDESGRLTQLGVLPKHWLSDNHPEWEEEDDVGELTRSEYESLLVKLEGVRRKGKLLERAKFPVISNTTARIRDIYERAVLETGDVVDARRAEDAPRAIKYFIVHFTTTNQTN
jgi:hypothetical protein